MADGGVINLDKLKQVVDVETILDKRKLDAVLKTLETSLGGANISKYFKGTDTLLNDLQDACQKFNRSMSDVDAQNLVNINNILKALKVDVDSIIPGFSEISNVIAKAEQQSKGLKGVIRVQDFKNAFVALDQFKQYGIDIGEIFSKLGAQGDFSELTNQLEQALRKNERLKERIASLRDQLDEANQASGIDDLRNKLNHLTVDAEDVFNAFLKLHNIGQMDEFGDYDSSKFSEYFEAIRNGSMSAQEAITKFKAEYGYLIEDNFKNSNNAFGLEQLHNFENVLEKVLTTVEKLREKMDTLPEDMKNVQSSKQTDQVLFDEDQLKSVLDLFGDIKDSLFSLRSVISDVGDGQEFSPLLQTIKEITSAVESLKKSVSKIGLNINIDAGEPDQKLLSNIEAKKQNLLNAYQSQFAAMKNFKIPGSIIAQGNIQNRDRVAALNKQILNFDGGASADNIDQRIAAYTKVIELMREASKLSYGRDVYADMDSSFKNALSSAKGQLTKAQNELANSNTLGSGVENLFGSKDLDQVVAQLSRIADKFEEIANAANDFKTKFADGINVTTSIEEIQKLTQRVQELEAELSKIKAINPPTVQEPKKDAFHENTTATDSVEKTTQAIKEENLALDETTNKAKQVISEFAKGRDVVNQNWYREKDTVIGKDSKGNNITRKVDEFSFVERLRDGQLQTVLATYNKETGEWAEQVINVKTAFEQVEKAIIDADNKIANLQNTRDKTLAAHPGYDTTGDDNQISIEQKKREELQKTLAFYGQEKEYVFEIEAANKRIAENQERLHNKSLSQSNLRQTVSTEQLDKAWGDAIAENNKRDTAAAAKSAKEISDAFDEATKFNQQFDNSLAKTISQLKELSVPKGFESSFDELQDKVSALGHLLATGKLSPSEYDSQITSSIKDYNSSINSKAVETWKELNSAIKQYGDIMQRFAQGKLLHDDIEDADKLLTRIHELQESDILPADKLNDSKRMLDAIDRSFGNIAETVDKATRQKGKDYVENAKKRLTTAMAKYNYGDTSEANDYIKFLNINPFHNYQNLDGDMKTYNAEIERIVANLKASHESFASLEKDEDKAWAAADKVNDAINTTNALLKALEANIPEGFTGNFKNAKDEIEKLNKDLTSGKKTVAEYNSGVKSAFKGYTDPIDEAGKNVWKELSSDLQRYSQLQQRIANGKAYSTDAADAQTLLDRIHELQRSDVLPSDKLKESNEKLRQINQTVEDITKSIKMNTLDNVQDTIDKYRTFADNKNNKPADQDQSAKYKQALADLNKAIQALEDYKVTLSGVDKITEENESKIKELTGSIEKYANTVKSMSAAEKGSNEQSRMKEADKITKYLQQNTRLSKEAKKQLESYVNLLRSSDADVDVGKIHTEWLKVTDAERAAGREGKSFFDVVKEKAWYGAASAIGTYFGLNDFIRYGQQGIQTVRKLDTALTEMRKVSDESTQSLINYQKSTFDIADAVGTTAKQIQNSTADYMRLGESLDQAAESARTANILFNVSEFTNIEDATKSLVAMGQAYKDLDKRTIVDKLNEVGNNYAISTDELASALQRSAATLSLMGNTIDEAAALVTTANATIQDADSVSAGLRTISLRLVGTSEAEEELSAMNEEIDAFVKATNSKKQQIIKDYTAVASNQYKGFDILDDNGNYKNTYEILLGIAKVYKEIQEQDKKLGTNHATALIEELAGKNRSNIASAILQDPSQLEAVKKSSEEALGSAEKELDKYLDSIDGRLQRLTNKTQEFWATAIDSDAIKGGITVLTNLVDLATALVDKLGLVKTAALGISAALSLNNVGELKLY